MVKSRPIPFLAYFWYFIPMSKGCIKRIVIKAISGHSVKNYLNFLIIATFSELWCNYLVII